MMKNITNYFVYMLRCGDGSFYTGITIDLEERIKKHNNGKASKYTRSRLPVEYIYIEEASDKSEALKREIKIKKLTRSKKEKLIEENKDNTKDFLSTFQIT